MKAATLILAAFLAGCATPRVEVSSPRSVVIQARLVGDAQALAEKECSRHGRHARLAGPGNRNTWAFDCVQ
jgi:hypothetical protein